jgi:hypothetical protein
MLGRSHLALTQAYHRLPILAGYGLRCYYAVACATTYCKQQRHEYLSPCSVACFARPPINSFLVLFPSAPFLPIFCRCSSLGTCMLSGSISISTSRFLCAVTGTRAQVVVARRVARICSVEEWLHAELCKKKGRKRAKRCSRTMAVILRCTEAQFCCPGWPARRCHRRPGRSGSGRSATEAKALKIHSEAERRRRERINAHLATLRRMIPDTKQVGAILLSS